MGFLRRFLWSVWFCDPIGICAAVYWNSKCPRKLDRMLYFNHWLPNGAIAIRYDDVWFIHKAFPAVAAPDQQLPAVRVNSTRIQVLTHWLLPLLYRQILKLRFVRDATAHVRGSSKHLIGSSHNAYCTNNTSIQIAAMDNPSLIITRKLSHYWELIW